MRTAIVVAILVVLGLAAGGGYYGLEVYPQQQFRAVLDQSLATLPPGTTASYKTAHYSVLSHHAVVTGMTVHGEIPGTPPQPFDVTAATIETDNPNMDFSTSWAHAVAAPADLRPDTALAVADSVAISGVTVHSPLVNVTEESVHIAKPRLYPWALLHDGMPSWKELQAAVIPKPGPPDMNNLRVLLRAEAALVVGFAYDSHEAGPIKVTESLPGIDIQYDVRKMSSGAFDRGIFKGGAAEAITLTGANVGGVTIDRVAMGTVDVREPMTRLVSGEPLSIALLNGITIGRIDYTGITATIPDHPPVHIGGMALGPIAFSQGMPVSGTLGWTDVAVSRTQASDPRAQAVFDKLGLDTLTVSFGIAYDWDVAQYRATLHDTMLKVNELGTVNVSADMTNVVPNIAGLTQVRLGHAKLRFDDASLMDRALRAGAAQAGTDPNAYRQQILEMVRQQCSVPANAGPAMQAACQAVGKFIESPHALTVELSPPQPVALASLKDMKLSPGMMATLFGLVVTANQ